MCRIEPYKGTNNLFQWFQVMWISFHVQHFIGFFSRFVAILIFFTILHLNELALKLNSKFPLFQPFFDSVRLLTTSSFFLQHHTRPPPPPPPTPRHARRLLFIILIIISLTKPKSFKYTSLQDFQRSDIMWNCQSPVLDTNDRKKTKNRPCLVTVWFLFLLP